MTTQTGDGDLFDTVEARAMSLTPEQCERYEDEAIMHMRAHPYATDDDLLAIMDRVARSGT